MKKFILFFIIFVYKIYASSDIIKIDELKPGMRGYGRTVFKGTEIEEFDVEIIAILRNVRPAGDLILAKLSGDKIEKYGVIAGMSGSPVYISNRIAGAIAFSWAFSKEPITAITPIEDMLKLTNRKNITDFYNFEPDMKNFEGEENYNLVPIKIPLFFNGISDNSIRIFKSDFEKLGFVPLSGGDLSLEKSSNSFEKFEPGSAVGVNIITGDLNLTGIGTVTYVKDNNILIFGHPVFSSGASDLPLSFAYIHTVVPSLYHSFKLGSPTKIAGRIYNDELYGLAGKLNENSQMINFKLNVNFFNNSKTFNFNIIKSYFLLPQLIGLCISRSIETLGGLMQNNTLNFKFELEFDNNKKITLSDSIPGLTLTESLSTGMILFLNPLSQILLNKFQKLNLRNIKGELNIIPKIKLAEIKNIIIDKREYNAGEKVKAKILLNEYQGKSFYINMEFILPNNLDAGPFNLIVSSGREAQFIDFQLSSAKWTPYNFEQFEEMLKKLATTKEIALWTIIKERGLVIKGELLERIPSSYYFILSDSPDKSSKPILTMLSEKIETDYIITGNAICPIKIVGKRNSQIEKEKERSQFNKKN